MLSAPSCDTLILPIIKGGKFSRVKIAFCQMLCSLRMISVDRDTPVACEIEQIASSTVDAETHRISTNGISFVTALIYGKVISVREKIQLILDHKGYKCKITVRISPKYIRFRKTRIVFRTIPMCFWVSQRMRPKWATSSSLSWLCERYRARW